MPLENAMAFGTMDTGIVMLAILSMDTHVMVAVTTWMLVTMATVGMDQAAVIITTTGLDV